MKIAIDARVLSGRFTGDRTYWLGLLSGLAEVDPANEYLLYLRTPVTEGAGPTGERFTTRIVSAPGERLWSAVAFPAAVKRDAADIAHVQYTVSPLMSVPTVTTIHDITFRLFPELFARRDRFLLNLTTPGSIRRAAAVIAVSGNTRNDILREYPSTPHDKVHAILEASDPRYRLFAESEQDSARGILKDRYGISGPFLLSVGVLQPRKNLPMLLRAFAAAKRRMGLPHKLVVTGKRGWLSDDTAAAISDAGDDCLFTGYVPDEDLPALYACADALAYPSLYEGFGLPPLEAMQSGCPVIASITSSLPEVVGDAGLLVAPTNEEAWVAGLSRLLSDDALRQQLREKGVARSKQFTWAETARRTLGVYEGVYEATRS